MDLKTYLEQRGVGVRLAKEIGVTPSFLAQIASGYKQAPIHRCTQIEQLTGGAVSRKDLRPNDWHLIWPELAEREQEAA